MTLPHAIRTFLPFLTLAWAALPAASQESSGAAQGSDPYAPVWEAWSARRFDEARALAERLAAERPDDPMAHAVLGYVLDQFGEHDAADPHLERAEREGARDPAVLRLVGDAHATRFGNLLDSEASYDAPAEREAAERAYRRWAEVAPDDPLPLARLAWIRRRAGEAQAALGLLYAAVSADPAVDGPHNDLWSFLNTEVTYDELAAFYEGLSLRDFPPATRARCADYQGRLLRYKGDKLRQDARKAGEQGDVTARATLLRQAVWAYDASIPCFERAAALDPSGRARFLRDRTEALVARVEAFADLEDFPAARRALEDARRSLVEEGIVGSPDFKRDIDRLSYALFRAAGGEAAQLEDLEAYRRHMGVLCDFWKWACEQVGDDAPWWNNYGFFAREAARYEESWRAYSKCIELAPDDPRYLNDAALIQVYHLGADLETAERLLRRAIDLAGRQLEEVRGDPRKEPELRTTLGDALLNLAVLCMQTGRLDEAASALDRLAELDPERMDLKQARRRLEQLRRGEEGPASETDGGSGSGR